MKDCRVCAAPGTVEVNGQGACTEHIDEVMADAFAPVKALREQLGVDVSRRTSWCCRPGCSAPTCHRSRRGTGCEPDRP